MNKYLKKFSNKSCIPVERESFAGAGNTKYKDSEIGPGLASSTSNKGAGAAELSW